MSYAALATWALGTVLLKEDSTRELAWKTLANGEELQAKPWNGSRSVTLGMMTFLIHGRTAQNLKGWCQSDKIWVWFPLLSSEDVIKADRKK